MKMQTSIPIHSAPKHRIALFERGFRPFFLLAGLVAVIMIAGWLTLLLGLNWPSGYFSPLGWHRHEMLFGYTTAVIAGFLLTAAQNWTGVPTAHGKPLIALILLWMTGRVIIFFPGPLPEWLIATLDISFLPALAVALAIPLLQRRQYHNYLFILILIGLAIANLLVHLQQLQIMPDSSRYGTLLALNIVVLLIVVMGGRVIPFFAKSALPEIKTRRWQSIEGLAIGAPVLVLIGEILAPESIWIAVFCTLAFVANGIRWLGWIPWRVGSVPLLWVLYLGYAWIILGFALKAVAVFKPQLHSMALHALTLGGIGGLTLGMMARVAIGHTGRQMRVRADMVLAFTLIHLAALFRVVLPLLLPSAYPYLTQVSGLLWLGAFSIFLLRYTSMLVKSRVDGKPG
jgi:uncharacterized protein involved in response to NO